MYLDALMISLRKVTITYISDPCLAFDNFGTLYEEKHMHAVRLSVGLQSVGRGEWEKVHWF